MTSLKEEGLAVREWLARQLRDDLLTDTEAFSVVAFHPLIKNQWLAAAPSPSIDREAQPNRRLRQLEEALRTARPNAHAALAQVYGNYPHPSDTFGGDLRALLGVSRMGDEAADEARL
jgi:hypothetical protein